MKELYLDKFSKGTDYKTAFTQEVATLTKQELTPEFKNKLSGGLIDAYFEQTGKIPDSIELEKLASWLVIDKTNDPHKVSKTDYPILSQGQVKRRQRREMVSDVIGETSDSTKHKMNGKRKPKNFKVFGEYGGGC